MAIDPSLPPSLQNLKPFLVDGKSQHAPGLYSIASPETNEQQPLVAATNEDIAATTWFMSPVRFMLKDRKHDFPLTTLTHSVLIKTRSNIFKMSSFLLKRMTKVTSTTVPWETGRGWS